ncbi:serine/threonine-protein kinase [Acidianus brierleyi]|nr:serine/threonine-protein kinase [Acidianus brierleyi]
MIFHPRYLYGNPFFLFSSIVAIISGILIIKDEEKKGLGLLSLGIIINVIMATDKNYMRISFLDPIFLTISFITWRIGNERPKLQTSQTVYYQPPIGYTTELKKTTFIFRGLPKNCAPTLEVCGIKYTPNIEYQGDYILELTFECSWRARKVKCNGKTYKPNKESGFAKLEDSIIINYYEDVTITQTTNKIKNTQNPPNSSSVPQCWINNKLSIYKIDGIIGEGGTGYVLKGNYSSKEVAIKVLKIQGNPQEYFNNLLQEASNLINLSNHPHIVKIFAINNLDKFIIDEIIKGNKSLYINNPPMIAMELMRGSLYDLLKEDAFFYSVRWRKNIFRAVHQIAEALDYMHSKGYVHMDVKPQNIFINKIPSDPSELDYVEFKLGDLGSAVRIGEKVRQLTLEYSPPEALIGKANPSFDVFALGMTLYVLLNRKNDRPDLKEMDESFNGDYSKIAISREKLNKWSENKDDVIRGALQMKYSIKYFMSRLSSS